MLVVDDERAWRVILETDLKMLGYKVSMAEDADQALVRAQADKPEVAIIDLMLPEPMDGWGLLTSCAHAGRRCPSSSTPLTQSSRRGPTTRTSSDT